MLENIKVAILNDEQNIWFIRANSGQYAHHFRSAGLIAIQHLEDAFENGLPQELPTENEIINELLQNEKYYKFVSGKDNRETKTLNRSGFALISQIKRFANDIRSGDLIVTKNADGGYNFGICSNDNAYIDHSPVKLTAPEGADPREVNQRVLKHKFRKKVTWGPSVPYSDLPGPVRKATRGQQTVTNLTIHRDKIFHLLYPFFTDGEFLYFSNKIKTEHSISALVVGRLFQNISMSEALLNVILELGDVDPEALAAILKGSVFSNGPSVTCQAEFMSPGDMWCKIPLSSASELLPQILAGVLACLILTGQAQAVEIDYLQQMPGNEIIKLKLPEGSSSSIFDDKYKTPEVSGRLKDIAKTLNNNADNVAQLEAANSVTEIRDSLGVVVTQTNTSKLERFSYGINVLEIGKPNENN